MHDRYFDGEAMSIIVNLLEDGPDKMEALREYIKEADESENYYYSLLWRYEYACQATFHSDPAMAIPVAAEFANIYEAHPSAFGSVQGNAGAESYLMITQMGIDPVISLPQIPMEQWEDMMEKFHALVKRFNIGHRTYWWQMAQFWQYVDKEKAHQYFEKFWKTGRDGLSDCPACERCYAVHMSLLVGDHEAADNYAKPLKAGRIHFCNDAPKIYRWSYLEYALDRGDLKEASSYASQLNYKIEHRIHDLSYLGAVVRCFAYTNIEKAVEKFASGMKLVLGLWDQKKVYDFYKGAYVCFHELAKTKDTVTLSLPEEFPLYSKNGSYNCKELEQWFYEQAEATGNKFDKRNNSSYFKENLSLALACEGKEVF